MKQVVKTHTLSIYEQPEIKVISTLMGDCIAIVVATSNRSYTSGNPDDEFEF